AQPVCRVCHGPHTKAAGCAASSKFGGAGTATALKAMKSRRCHTCGLNFIKYKYEGCHHVACRACGAVTCAACGHKPPCACPTFCSETCPCPVHPEYQPFPCPLTHCPLPLRVHSQKPACHFSSFFCFPCFPCFPW